MTEPFDHHNANLNPASDALEADDALLRRVLLQGEYHAFVALMPRYYLHRVIAAARVEGYVQGREDAEARFENDKDT